jgi:hypothetical protein
MKLFLVINDRQKLFLTIIDCREIIAGLYLLRGNYFWPLLITMKLFLVIIDCQEISTGHY